MSLVGRTAIITGGAGGIGYAIAQLFAREGAKVIIADLDQTLSENAAADIAGATSGTVTGIGMDVADEDSVESGFQQMIDACGTIDILVNSAGTQHIGSLENLAYKDWKKILAVHLDGAFLTTRACLRNMYISKKGGSIIYLGSVHSKTASVLKGPYVTAKHGVLGLCRVVAKEGAPYGVRANVIYPGFVQTGLVEKQIPEQARLRNISEAEVVAHMLENTLDNAFTTVDEVAETALFLASRKSLAITGQSILVSHGWFME
jgi:3-hydroxybutyrate dehydrogenase